MRGTSQGLYGVRVTGLDDCPSLGSVPMDWPSWQLTVSREVRGGSDGPPFLGPDRALHPFLDGSVAEVHRERTGGRISLSLTTNPSDNDLAHPYLAVLGAVSAFWFDRLPLHAGAFAVAGVAWLIAGGKGDGKSTALAMLSQAGYPVLADDLSIVDADFNVHRGPRFVDLRPDVARRLGLGTNIGVLGLRERWRHPVGDAPLKLPLGGLVFARWGEPRVEPITGAERLTRLAKSVMVRIPGSWAGVLMDVVGSVPIVEWSRPRVPDGASSSIERLVRQTESLRA